MEGTVGRSKENIRSSKAALKAAKVAPPTEHLLSKIKDATANAEPGLTTQPAYVSHEYFQNANHSLKAQGQAAVTHVPKQFTGELMQSGRRRNDIQGIVDSYNRSVKRSVQWPRIQQTLNDHARLDITGPKGLPVWKLVQELHHRGLEGQYKIWTPGRAQEVFDAASQHEAPVSTLADHGEAATRSALTEGLHDPKTLKAAEPQWKSVRAFAIPNDVANEITPAVTSKAARVVDIARAKVGRNMFAGNVPWAKFNLLTNAMLAMASPHHAAQARRLMKDLDPLAQDHLAPWMDVQSRQMELGRPRLGSQGTALTRWVDAAANRIPIVRAHPIRSTIDAWFQVERNISTVPFTQARMVKMLKADKRVERIDVGTGKALSAWDELQSIAKLPAHEQAAAITSPRIQHMLSDAYDAHAQNLGDWLTFTKAERKGAARYGMFYGWVRFSTMFLYVYMPKNYPALFAANFQGDRINRKQLAAIYGKNIPSQLTGLIPRGKGAMDVTRVSPGGNAITESRGQTPLQTILGASNPLLKTGIDLAAQGRVSKGLKPFALEGKSAGSIKHPSAADLLRVGLSDLTKIPYLSREAGRRSTPKVQGEDSIVLPGIKHLPGFGDLRRPTHGKRSTTRHRLNARAKANEGHQGLKGLINDTLGIPHKGNAETRGSIDLSNFMNYGPGKKPPPLTPLQRQLDKIRHPDPAGDLRKQLDKIHNLTGSTSVSPNPPVASQGKKPLQSNKQHKRAQTASATVAKAKPTLASIQPSRAVSAAPAASVRAPSPTANAVSAPVTRTATVALNTNNSGLRAHARQAAQRYGLDPGVFERQIQQESGFNPHGPSSSAGAQGIAQIMPATARGWGVNPNDPKAALDAAAKHMAAYVKQYGSVRNALIAYNAGPGRVGKSLPAETQHYLDVILNGKSGKSSGSSKTKSLADIQPAKRSLAQTSAIIDYFNKPYTTTADLMSLKGALDAHPALPPPVGGTRTLGSGKVVISKGADRAGVSTSPKVLDFARKVAGVYGKPLTIGTGTNHNQMTVNGNVSDHWDGNAVDIPASGKALIRLGQAALIAAGMSPAKARKQMGGLYTVRGHQIIFATNAPGVGNHMNHLHISA